MLKWQRATSQPVTAINTLFVLLDVVDATIISVNGFIYIGVVTVLIKQSRNRYRHFVSRNPAMSNEQSRYKYVCDNLIHDLNIIGIDDGILYLLGLSALLNILFKLIYNEFARGNGDPEPSR